MRVEGRHVAVSSVGVGFSGNVATVAKRHVDFACVVEHIVRMPPDATLVAKVSCVDTHVARVPPEATLSGIYHHLLTHLL